MSYLFSERRRTAAGPGLLAFNIISTVEVSSSLVRFIIPLLIVAAAAYFFRLFSFGWRIYRPSAKQDDGGVQVIGYQKELEMVREGQYMPYVDAMGEAVRNSGGDMALFARLRSELTELNIEKGDSSASGMRTIDSVVGEMVSLYRESTGREGISLTGEVR